MGKGEESGRKQNPPEAEKFTQRDLDRKQEMRANDRLVEGRGARLEKRHKRRGPFKCTLPITSFSSAWCLQAVGETHLCHLY